MDCAEGPIKKRYAPCILCMTVWVCFFWFRNVKMVLLTEDCLAYLGNWKTESAPPVSKANERTHYFKRDTLRRGGGGRGLGETCIITSSLFSRLCFPVMRVWPFIISSGRSSSKRIERWSKQRFSATDGNRKCTFNVPGEWSPRFSN